MKKSFDKGTKIYTHSYIRKEVELLSARQIAGRLAKTVKVKGQVEVAEQMGKWYLARAVLSLPKGVEARERFRKQFYLLAKAYGQAVYDLAKVQFGKALKELGIKTARNYVTGKQGSKNKATQLAVQKKNKEVVKKQIATMKESANGIVAILKETIHLGKKAKCSVADMALLVRITTDIKSKLVDVPNRAGKTEKTTLQGGHEITKHFAAI